MFYCDFLYLCGSIQQCFLTHDIIRLDNIVVKRIRSCVAYFILVDVYTTNLKHFGPSTGRKTAGWKLCYQKSRLLKVSDCTKALVPGTDLQEKRCQDRKIIIKKLVKLNKYYSNGFEIGSTFFHCVF